MKTQLTSLTQDFLTADAAHAVHSGPPCLSLYQPTHRHHPGNQQDPLRFQVLGLSLHAIKLFEGNRDSLDEIVLAPGVPGTITEALGEELTEPHQTVASYGGTSLGGSMRHGHGGKKDEVEIDADRFFRAVDQAVLQHHSRPLHLPLLLAALPEHHGLFHQISKNPFLLGEGIKAHPDAMPQDELREKAWQVFEPHYRSRLTKLADEFALAKSKGLGLEELQSIAEAAAAGRIATLLVEADREIAGRMDAATGKLQLTDLSQRPADTVVPVSHDATGKLKLTQPGDPGLDDVLNELGEMVSNHGGQVVVIPSEQMPTKITRRCSLFACIRKSLAARGCPQVPSQARPFGRNATAPSWARRRISIATEPELSNSFSTCRRTNNKNGFRTESMSRTRTGNSAAQTCTSGSTGMST